MHNQYKKLFDYGFSCVQQVDLAAYLPDISLPVVGGVSSSVRALPTGDTKTVVLSGEERQITAKVYVEPFYYAPLLQEQKVGEVSFYLGEQELGSWDLYPQHPIEAQEIEEKGFWDWVKGWFGR